VNGRPGAVAADARARTVHALDSIARAAVDQGEVAGRSVAVVRGRDTLLFRAYGSARLVPRVATPDDAVYEIGSVTKQFTAAAVLLLVARGALALDAPVAAYLSDVPRRVGSVTVRQLLNHTTGLRDYAMIPAVAALGAGAAPRDSLVALVAAEPPLFAPGAAQSYSNSGYFVAGRLVERVAGVPYEDFVERELFGRLGMRHSAYCGRPGRPAPTAVGHVVEGSTLVPSPPTNHRWPYAAGSLCASLGDLVTWLRALHGGRVLAPALYRAMTTPARLADGTALRYGLGLYVGDDPAGHAMLGHGGAIPGYLSETRYYPVDDLAIVVLQNTNGAAPPERLADAPAERVLGRRPRSGADADPDLARGARYAGYAGLYAGPTRAGPDAAVRVAVDGGRLTYRLGDGEPSGLRERPDLGPGTFEATAARRNWPFTPVRLTFAVRGDTVRVDTGFEHAVLVRR
jgi:CubicO group peptidase (beta-lactamase class C family)